MQTVNPSLALFLTILHLALSNDNVNIVYPNHHYIDSTTYNSQTPRTLDKPFIVNHPEPYNTIPLQNQRVQQQVGQKNLTSYHPVQYTFYNPYSQSPKISKVKRSGDYHYGNMDYHQYEVDDHEPLYQPQQPHMPIIRTMPYPIRHHPHPHEPKFDVSTLGMLALMKLGMLKMMKLGFLGMLLMMLIKMPMMFGMLGMKMMLVMKMIKMLKLLAIPIIIPIIIIILIPILIPLFLLLLPVLIILLIIPIIPLIIIPLLLPLLLLLPVPVLAPAAGRRRRREAEMESRRLDDDVLYLIRRVLESEQCIERVACQLAAHKQSRSFSGFVAWYLEKTAGYIKNTRFRSYAEAYKKGTTVVALPQCKKLYSCNNPRKAL